MEEQHGLRCRWTGTGGPPPKETRVRRQYDPGALRPKNLNPASPV